MQNHLSNSALRLLEPAVGQTFQLKSIILHSACMRYYSVRY